MKVIVSPAAIASWLAMGPVRLCWRMALAPCLWSLALLAQGASMQWTGIRDGSLYLQTDRPDQLVVR